MTNDKRYVYICDAWNDRIQIINSDGIFIRCLKSNGKNKEGKITVPQRIAINDSLIYVTNFYERVIMVFDIKNCNFIKKIKCHDIVNTISVYKSLIYISFCSDLLIHVHNLEGELVREINCRNVFPIKILYTPTSLCITNDEIYIAELIYGEIVCLSIEGSYKFSITRKNNGGRMLESPCYVVLTERSIYVSDRKGIHQFDRTNNRIVTRWKDDNLINVGEFTFLDDKCFVSRQDQNCIYVFR